jgi:hypothetical protein
MRGNGAVRLDHRNASPANSADRQRAGEKRPVIVGELESELLLRPVELRVIKTHGELDTAKAR